MVRTLEEDALHTELVCGIDIVGQVVHKDGFIGSKLELIERQLEDAGIRLYEADLRRENQGIEGVVQFVFDEEAAHIGPGIGDDTGLNLWAKGTDKSHKVAIEYVAGEKLKMDGFGLGGGTTKPAGDGVPMFVGCYRADGSLRLESLSKTILLRSS